MADNETRKLVEAMLRDRQAVQREAIGRVEAKATIVLGFAVTASQFVLAREVSSDFLPWSLAAWLGSLVACFLVVVTRAHGELDPKLVMDDLWERESGQAYSRLARGRLFELEYNAKRHRLRIVWWRVAIVALLLAAVLSGAHLRYGSETMADDDGDQTDEPSAEASPPEPSTDDEPPTPLDLFHMTEGRGMEVEDEGDTISRDDRDPS